MKIYFQLSPSKLQPEFNIRSTDVEILDITRLQSAIFFLRLCREFSVEEKSRPDSSKNRGGSGEHLTCGYEFTRDVTATTGRYFAAAWRYLALRAEK